MPRKQFIAIVDAGCGIHVPIRTVPAGDPVQETSPATVIATHGLLDALDEPYRILLWLEADAAGESA